MESWKAARAVWQRILYLRRKRRAPEQKSCRYDYLYKRLLMHDWRLEDPPLFLMNATIKQIHFPEFWQTSYKQKNDFYHLIKTDAENFVSRFHRGEEFLHGEKIQAFWHVHCLFCTAKITTDKLIDCYCTEDYTSWICQSCLEDFRNLFQWKIIQSDDRAPMRQVTF